ncbi:two-component system histidine kinase PnpS [Shimazuella kribbensis]|uniref:two-component system histidine kinase PnpS n=1 Tax=Shimazuella kribbensis TaxID=139808 RepID=UPI000408A5EE|nr:ATP-binding protein [Shimazuella kribbensis]
MEALNQKLIALQESTNQMNSVIEALDTGMIMVDQNGIIKLVNRSFGSMFDLPVDQMIGTHYDAYLSNYNLSPFLLKCMETNTPKRLEMPLFYPQERMVEASLTPIQENNQQAGLVAIFRDLTAFRHLEDLRRDFVANVSHELKTPLTSIVGFTETLLDGARKDPDTCKEFLQIIYKEGLRLQRLVSDLLDLSKIESKQIPIKMEIVSVQMVVHDVVETLVEQMQAKNLRLLTDVAPLMVKMDTDCVRQILVNLLANAMNYTPVGGKVTVKVKQNKQHWLLQVMDTGIGIPESDQPRIFERFYRVDKARSRNSGGTGLGLAIVKHLVELQHGEIEVESAVGKGSIFTVRFPLDVSEI